MPRYARMSPESANIFDNLHMLHGIAYSILAYPGWSIEEKRAEMYRVIEAMGYQPATRPTRAGSGSPIPNSIRGPIRRGCARPRAPWA